MYNINKLAFALKKRRSKYTYRDFPGGPVTKTQAFNAGGPGLIPSHGTRSQIPQQRPNTAKQIFF